MSTPERTYFRSTAAFEKSRRVLPGGVNSPVRAFKGVGGTPLFIKQGRGATITDIDGNTYIDYVGSYGPLIAGHAEPRVVKAICDAVALGTSYGAPTELETELATTIIEALPAMEMIRFVNSGTEAAMSAVRLARAATGRDLVVKCIGCYHGHVDGLLVEAGSGALTLGTPSSPGIPKSVTSATVTISYNDLDAAAAVFEKYPNQIACFAVEPVAGNMGVVPPAPGYLAGLRKLCDRHGTLLLFDEVMTGFRVAWGGAQVLYDVKPDITCLGKVIGGGLPVGAYGGSRALMERVSPAGPVYQAGTLSGNPVAMTAGIATLKIMQEPGAYDRLESAAKKLAEGLVQVAADAKVPVSVNRVGSMVGLFFTRNAGDVVTNYTQATGGDTAAYARFFHAMLDNGVYLAPSMFEVMFVGLAHAPDVIQRTIDAAGTAMAAVLEPMKSFATDLV